MKNWIIFLGYIGPFLIWFGAGDTGTPSHLRIIGGLGVVATSTCFSMIASKLQTCNSEKK